MSARKTQGRGGARQTSMNEFSFFADDSATSVVTSTGQSIALVNFGDDGCFRVNDEAVAILARVEAPVAVVSVAGLYRTGKSFLLNRVILQNHGSAGAHGFVVGPTTRACTKGIWMWTEPLQAVDVHGRNVNVIVIDTEGIGAPTADATHDTRIFALGLLLSSYFIYNSVGSIDEQALSNMSLVTNLSTQIRGHVEVDGESDVPEKPNLSFPAFLWVVRDFALQLRDASGRSIGSKEYLEDALKDCDGRAAAAKNRVRACLREYFPDRDCFTLVRPCTDEGQLQNLDTLPNKQLRPEFLEQAAQLRAKILAEAVRRPNTINDCELSGTMLGLLCRSYVGAINEGRVPVIQDAWSYVCDAQRAKTEETVVTKFQAGVSALFSAPGITTPPQFAHALHTLQTKTLDQYESACRSLFPHDNPASFVDALATKLRNFSALPLKQFNQGHNVVLVDVASSAMHALESAVASGELATLTDLKRAVQGAYTAFTARFVEPGRDVGSMCPSGLCPDYADAAHTIWYSRLDPFLWRTFQAHFGGREGECIALKAEVEKLHVQLRDTTAQHASAMKQLERDHADAVRAKETNYTTLLREQHDELESLRELLAASNARQDALHAEMVERAEADASALAQARHELETQKLRAETAEKQVAVLKLDVEEMEEEVEMIQEQERQISELTLERDRLRLESTEARKQAADYKKQLTLLDTTFRKETKEMQEKMQQSLQTIKEARRAEQAQLRAGKEEAQARCAATEGLLKSTTDELTRVKRQQEESASAYEAEAARQRTQLEESEARMQALQREYTSKLSEAERVRKEREKAEEATTVRTREEKLRMEQEHMRRIKELEGRALSAETQLAAQRQQTEALEELRRRKRPRTDETNQSLQLVKADAELKWLREQKTEADSRVAELTRANADLEAQVRTLERAMDTQLTRTRLEYESQIASLEYRLTQTQA